VDVKIDVGSQEGKSVISKWKYAVGQPMGLYGSFNLFALTHHLLLRAIHREVDKPRRLIQAITGKKQPELIDNKLTGISTKPWRILGDDIVVGCKRVAHYYERVMGDLGVDISVLKSNVSNRLAQFAGKVVIPNQVLDGAKIPNPKSGLDNSFDQYLRVIGWKGLMALPSRVRRVARIFCLLPRELGGLGYNPKGLSLDDRLSLLLEKKVTEYIPRSEDLGAILSHMDIYDGSVVDPMRAEMVIRFLVDQTKIVEDRCKSYLGNLQNIPTNVR
jgi:hypothetical protein